MPIQTSKQTHRDVHKQYMEYISKIKVEGMISRDNFYKKEQGLQPKNPESEEFRMPISIKPVKLKPPYQNIEQIFQPLYTQIESEKRKEGILKSLALSLAQSKANSRLTSG